MAFQTLLQEYMLVPPVTRAYTTACVITTLAVQLDLVSPFQLYFNPILILKKYQLWRLLTTFLFFGNLGFNFFFNMIFTYRYCRMLEEGSFRSRTADFVVMFIFGGILMIICAFFVNLLFLGQAFTIMIVYIWSRRNIHVGMNFFGLMNFQINGKNKERGRYFFRILNCISFLCTVSWPLEEFFSIFKAPYLPWVLLGFSVLLGNSISVDLVGMAIGHVYFFLEDVLPRQRGGQKILKTPKVLKKLFDPAPEEPDYVPLPEVENELANVRPGGFDWRNHHPNNEENR